MAKMNYHRRHNRTLTSVFSESGNPYALRNISAEVRYLEPDLRQRDSEALREARNAYKGVLKALPPRPSKSEQASDKAFIEQAIRLINALLYERGEL